MDNSQGPSGETYDMSGLRFRALNNGESLYLTVSAHEAGAKAVLTGEIRQDVTIWFLAGKTRAWGLRLPFGSLGVPWENGMPAGTIEPEQLTAGETAVSTAPLPGNIEFGGEIPGRVPIYELEGPAVLAETGNGGIAPDFITSYASADTGAADEREIPESRRWGGGQDSPRPGMKPQGGMSGRGGGKMGRGGGRGNGGTRGGSRRQPEFPAPMEIEISYP
jgi:hypothetical protein